MKGFGMISVNHVGWIEKDAPKPHPMDAILKPVAVAACTSDVHFAQGFSGPFKNRILGHESIGEVVEVGSAVRHFKPGDRVVVNSVTPNWERPLIQDSCDNNAHDKWVTSSFKFCMQKDGVFAEYYHVNNADANLYPLPEDVSLEDALMTTDMMSTGFYAVENAEVRYGDNVAVFGIGPVGLMAVAGAALRGCGRLIAIDDRPSCEEMAREFGATDIVSFREEKYIEKILDLNHGQVDKVILAGGNAATFRDALQLVRPNGTISNVNFMDARETIEIPTVLWGLGMSNITLRSGFCPGGARRVERMLRIVQAGRLHPGRLCNYRLEGFEKIEEAFHLMADKPKDLIKPYVVI